MCTPYQFVLFAFLCAHAIFFSDNMDTGPPALACFIITALCPLSRRWLFMEQTAQGGWEGGREARLHTCRFRVCLCVHTTHLAGCGTYVRTCVHVIKDTETSEYSFLQCSPLLSSTLLLFLSLPSLFSLFVFLLPALPPPPPTSLLLLLLLSCHSCP